MTLRYGDIHEVELPDGNCVDVEITSYRPAEPMIITGWGYGDAEPPEPAEWEWDARDPETGLRVDELSNDDINAIEAFLEQEDR